jgi:DNA polymerase-3 subunit beta
MRLNTTKDILLKGIQSTQNAINTKSSLPILSNILIEAEGDTTILTATDLDIGITTTLPIKPDVAGSVTIPAKKFFDIIKELPESEILISVKKNNLVNIECESCSFKIMGLPKDEFPQLPEFKDKDSIILPQKKLKEMLDMTSFAMSRDETRYVLNGVLLIIKPAFIRLIATDGRRLAVAEHKIQLPKTQERKAIIPAKTVNELSRMLGDEGDVKISFGENQASFNIGPTKIISRLIEGEFPNYEAVIPKESKEKLVAHREKFISALKRVALFTNQESMAVKIDVTRDKAVFSKSTRDIGEVREELAADYKGKDLSMGFNPDYLIDVLKAIEKEMIGIELVDSEKPGVVRVGDEYVYVVLPMQIV